MTAQHQLRHSQPINNPIIAMSTSTYQTKDIDPINSGGDQVGSKSQARMLPPLSFGTESGPQPLSPEAQALAQEIYDQLLERGPLTFAALRAIDGFEGDEGDLGLSDLNVLIWPNVTQNTHEAITALIYSKVVATELCHPSSYLFDGAWIPDLPRFRGEPPAKGFKKLHWAPTRLRIIA